MKINIAKSAGFCFGVKRALKVAFEAAQSNITIEMLGDIVHNEAVVKEIKKIGIKKIERLKAGKGKALLIRAHGAGTKTFQEAKKLGYKIIDATCPMVKEIHRIARESEQKGYLIIVIGDKKHDEVQGIVGQLKTKAIVIDRIANIPFKTIKRIKKAAVIVQSTQDADKILEIVEKLKQHINELKFFNTICNPTRTKQKEVKTLPLKNDIMIIIGSKTSANTKRLYQISKSLNKRSYWIQSEKNIRRNWFKNVKSVGISAGASTPDYTTQKVVDYIKSFSAS